MARTKDNPQSRELRQRLLHTAGEVFAEQGFRAATVRQITERAGVNLAAINYYFSDKAELYACALREAHCHALGGCPSEGSGTPRERLRSFLTSLLTFLLDPARPAWQNRLLAREIAEPSAALDVLIEGMRARNERLKAIVCDLAGVALPPQKLALFCCSIMGQCIHHAQNRAVVERIHPVLSGYHDRINLLAEHITEFSVPAIKEAGRAATKSSLTRTHERRSSHRRTPVATRNAPR